MMRLEDRNFQYKEPEWTAENINKKEGDTTFKQCGWCKHHGGGSCRYDCHLSTNCSLLKSYGIGQRVYWDTPCLVILMGKTDMNSVIKSKKWEIDSLRKQMASLKGNIDIIKNLKLKDRPSLPDNRTHDYNEGETIWTYIDNKWAKGIVVPGYRSHDGCVSFILEDYPKSKPKPEGEGPWGCGAGVPEILTDKEYHYFKEHHDDFRTWLHLSDREYNGNRAPIDEMYAALTGGTE